MPILAIPRCLSHTHTHTPYDVFPSLQRSLTTFPSTLSFSLEFNVRTLSLRNLGGNGGRRFVDGYILTVTGYRSENASMPSSLKSTGNSYSRKCYGVYFDEYARTALAFVTLRSDGEREFMFYRNPSADMLLKESEINMEMVKKAKNFHYGSISLITEPCRSAHMAAMKAAKDAGVLLSYDPNVSLPLWPSAEAAKQGIMSIWKEADFIKVSDDELNFLIGKDSDKEEVVLSLWHDGLKLLVVTDGEKGCRYFTKSFKGKVPGFAVKAIDTTGAGDSFAGSLLVSIAKDADFPDCILTE